MSFAETLSKRVEAAEQLAVMLADGMLADQMGGSFTCAEADTLAEYLEAWGAPDDAKIWLNSHAQSDDEGDDHYELRLALEQAETGEE